MYLEKGILPELIDYTFHDETTTSAYYRLIQIDIDGSTKVSDVIYIDNEKCNNSSGFIIYPNPAESYINIQQFGSISKEIIILDVMGKIIYKAESTDNIRINTSNWAKGLYFVKNKNEMQTFIIL